jgi:DNA-directed RNA polymerase specialized sigma24 family protein
MNTSDKNSSNSSKARNILVSRFGDFHKVLPERKLDILLEAFAEACWPESLGRLITKSEKSFADRFVFFCLRIDWSELDMEEHLSKLFGRGNDVHDFVTELRPSFLKTCSDDTLHVLWRNYLVYRQMVAYVKDRRVFLFDTSTEIVPDGEQRTKEAFERMRRQLSRLLREWEFQCGQLHLNDFWNDLVETLTENPALYRYLAKFENWTLGVLQNYCIRQARRQTKLDRLEGSEPDGDTAPLLGSFHQGFPSPERVVLSEERVRLIREGILLVVQFFKDPEVVKYIIEEWLLSGVVDDQALSKRIEHDLGSLLNQQDIQNRRFKFNQRTMAYWLGRVERSSTEEILRRVPGTRDRAASRMAVKLGSFAKPAYPNEPVSLLYATCLALELNYPDLHILKELSSLEGADIKGIKKFLGLRKSLEKEYAGWRKKVPTSAKYLVFPTWYLTHFSKFSSGEILNKLAITPESDEAKIISCILHSVSKLPFNFVKEKDGS